MEELASLVREMPVAPMSAERADAVRDAVLAEAVVRLPSPFPSTWTRAAMAIAAGLFASLSS